MSFIWADKISLFFFCFLALVGWGMCGGYALDWAMYDRYLWLAGTLAAGLWCMLRLIDFLAGGPARRSRRWGDDWG